MKHVKLTIEQFEALMTAGQKCSNVCFNLAQRDHPLPHDKSSMEASFRDWDTAARAARAAIKKPSHAQTLGGVRG